jgi:hypothetical protein
MYIHAVGLEKIKKQPTNTSQLQQDKRQYNDGDRRKVMLVEEKDEIEEDMNHKRQYNK